MQTYLQRYQQGRKHLWSWRREARRVWAELVSYGAAIREEPLYNEAKAVAQDMMTRARHNIELLVNRLHELGYRFAVPDRVWIPPSPDLTAMLNGIEQAYGPLPLALRAWFDIVGSVNFMGAHPKLSREADLNWGGSEQIDGDPLVVESIFSIETGISSYNDLYEVMIAPDAALKAGESGSGPVFMLVPNAAFDVPLIDSSGYWTGTFFVHHLQTCFEWGGFPGLNRPSTAEKAQAELAFLTKDLLPII